MKRLFLGSVALVALGLGAPAAFAAELRAPAYTPPPPAPPAYTWSGCYIGGGGGYSSGTSTHSTTAGSVLTQRSTAFGTPLPAGANITDSFNLSGFIGTGQLGCNWQWGAWVFGIEGDGSATNKEGQAFENTLASIPGLGARAGWISQTQERWLVTARGRLGLTNFWWFGPQTLVYVTGGGAWEKIDTSEFLSGVSINRSHQERNTRGGRIAGGGLEC